jgi:hypothetical protein
MDTVNVQSINFVQSSCKALSVADLNILRQNALVLPETARHFSDHRAVSARNINNNKLFFYSDIYTPLRLSHVHGISKLLAQ